MSAFEVMSAQGRKRHYRQLREGDASMAENNIWLSKTASKASVPRDKFSCTVLGRVVPVMACGTCPAKQDGKCTGCRWNKKK